MNARRKTKGQVPPFAIQVAQFAVEDAFRLSAKNASQRFVALVVPPRAEDAEVYEDAVGQYLRTFLNSLPGDPRPSHIQVEAKSLSTRLLTYTSLNHIVLIVPDPQLITRDARLSADRVISLREPTAEDFRRAVRTVYDKLIPVDSASFLVGKPLSILALAFPRGRSYSTAMRKAHAYFRNTDAADRTVKNVQTKKTPRDRRTLDQMPGYGDAKTWGMRLAADLADWKSGRIDWSEVDKGVVLMGPPGVGKTVFAKALANSCGVPLLHTSAARWVAKGHLGDALKAMQKSFSEARSQAPAILFVDELDSFPSRDRDDSDKSEYTQQFVNSFLECLDGIESRDGIVVVGATNRIQDVDPAVLRSGRLERVIEIPLPDAEVRNEILRLNLPALPPGPSKHFDLATVGWSGAEIEQFARDVSRQCRALGCEPSMDVVEASLPALTPLEKDVHFRVAIHEAGHALYARMFEHRNVTAMTVSAFAPNAADVASGVVVIEEPRSQGRTETWYRGQLSIAIAGIAAERLVFGVHGDGCGGSEFSDLARATHLATCMVVAFGMCGTWSAEATTDSKTLSTLRRLDPQVRNQVEAIMDGQFREVTQRLASVEAALRKLAQAVMEMGALEGAQIDAVIGAAKPPEITSSTTGLGQ